MALETAEQERVGSALSLYWFMDSSKCLVGVTKKIEAQQLATER